MEFFDAERTAAALPFDRLIPALRTLFAAGCEVPPRQVLSLHAGDGPPVTSLVMPAWLPGRCYAVKVVNIAPGNAAAGRPALHSTLLLHDATTGVPLAVIDGDPITARRTAAASALAASHLARPDTRHLLVVGAGTIAALLPHAYRTVLPIERVSVWSRSGASAVALAARWRAEGIDAEAVDDLAAAAGRADAISCATLATAPLIEGRWLRPGSHLDLIGSFTPAMREADDDCFAGATIVVDTREALVKSGDLIGPLQRGVFARDDVHGDLAELVRGQAPGRRSADARTVFKSVGTALEDLAAAMLVHASAGGNPPAG